MELAEKNRLPEWAEAHPTDPNGVLVDADKMYPALLAEFGFDPDKPTKYAVETCFQCAKMDLQTALRRYNFTIYMRADDGRKDRWALANLPGSGRDVIRATKGREAKELYRQRRGFVPG